MIRSRYKYISWLLPPAAIVLVLLIAIPAIPAHAQAPTTIDVSAPDPFDFGTFAVGVNTLDPAPGPGLVVITEGTDGATGYTVTAMDADQVTNPGFMLTGEPATTPLLSQLEIFDGTTWANASTGLTYTGDLTGGALNFDARQNIVGTELAGDYTITIEFAGAITVP